MAHSTEAEAVEADIRATQARIDATIDALKARLSPSTLMDHGMSYLKEHGGELGRTAGRKIAENPLPLVMMAAATAWLMIADGRSKTSGSPSNDESWNEAREFGAHREALSLHERVRAATADLSQGANESWASFTERLHDARAEAMGVARNVGEDVASFRERVALAFADLTSRASQAAEAMHSHISGMQSKATDAAHSAGRFASETGQRLGGKAEEVFNEYPLVVGAFGVALGALAGALIPRTKIEDEVLGDAGAALRDTASDLAAAARHKVEDAAEHISRSVAEAADEVGLTVDSAKAAASELVEKAEHFAEKTPDAVEDEVRQTVRSARQQGPDQAPRRPI